MKLRKSQLVPYAMPIALYLAGVALAWILTPVKETASLLLLYASAVIASGLMWRLTRWPDAWSKYCSFGAVLLWVCAINHALYVADLLVGGPRFSEWPFFSVDPQLAMIQGEVMYVLGTFITVLAWRAAGGLRVSPGAALVGRTSFTTVLMVMYAGSLGAMSLAAASRLVSGRLGQLLPTLQGLGIACSFLLPLRLFKGERKRLLAVVLLSVPFVITASTTGMKENIILSLLPTAVLVWRHFRNPGARIALTALSLIAAGVVTSYVGLYRSKVWVQGSAPASTAQVRQDYLRKIDSQGFLATSGAGLKGFLDRNDASYYHGWAVSIANEQRLHPELVFDPLTYVLVPRIVWPDKPSIRTGWLYSAVVFGPQYIVSSGSSTAAGFYPAMYLGGGWLAVLVGAVLAGALFASMTRLALRLGGTRVAGLYILAMLPFMLRMSENWPDGVLAGPVIACVYVVGIATAAKVIAGFMGKARGSVGISRV